MRAPPWSILVTTSGQGRLLATTAAGQLHSYKITGGSWKRNDLKESEFVQYIRAGKHATGASALDARAISLRE
ncbi:hypothetical protein ACIF6H_04035 [Streptomyces microflavus]|uniref:Uncharacterized protein n=1 Tax=Streptomyces microflavus TaxID=1919 RepID=A0A6N9VHG0_STRMI|nr:MULTISPECIES: hypothetical protein [Streptomyces]MBW3358384.1 hypothetical protein [Streptomyces sp. 09ZI22]MEE1728792.1 hypothetical protein [Streptomyces sp. BE282]NEB72143.1 hypothetical protein [Streptomyces microflavus]NEE49100.1 hypothetical protein [Streptomyces sp. SID8455]